MIHEGQIVLFEFPTTTHVEGKLRPALVLRKLPIRYDDWLICMVSSQLSQHILGLDEIIRPGDTDFVDSGLKVASIVRSSRLAVVSGLFLLGSIGEITTSRLGRIKQSVCNWIMNT